MVRRHQHSAEFDFPFIEATRQGKRKRFDFLLFASSSFASAMFFRGESFDNGIPTLEEREREESGAEEEE